MLDRTRTLLLALLLAYAGPAAAQVAGRVVEEEGRPVPGATVELWTASRRLAQTRTDDAGRFSFARDSAVGATSVAAHRLGFQAASTALAQGREVVVRLSPAPLALAGVRVRSRARPPCPNRETARARTTWQLASARYTPPGTLPEGARVRSERWEATVPRDEIGVVEGRRPVPGEFDARDLRRVGAASDGMLAGAYARRADFDGQEHWEYAPLAWGLNAHFVGERFGALHSFSVMAERADGVVLAFCPNRRDVPGIEGTLTVSHDGILRGARWTHRTPRTRSQAGGEVDYLPPDPATQMRLLPRRGLFWRSWRGRFHFREDRYVEWLIPAAAPR